MRKSPLVTTVLLTVFFTMLTSLTGSLSGCSKTENKTEEKPVFVIAGPQREQLQKAKELEKKMQQDAEDQRKVIELQSK